MDMKKLILAGAVALAMGSTAVAGGSDADATVVELDDERTTHVFVALDQNNDGFLTEDEVADVEAFEQTFHLLDADGDHRIDAEEMLLITTWSPERLDERVALYEELEVRYPEMVDGHDAMSMRTNETDRLEADPGIDKYDSDWAKTRDDIDVDDENETEADS